MAFAHAIANRPSPYRLQVVLDDVTGPLISSALGYFDPRRDLAVYNAGRVVAVKSFTWDPARNRYLLFLSQALDFSAPIQVIHHVPAPAFTEDAENQALFSVSSGQDPDLFLGTVATSEVE